MPFGKASRQGVIVIYAECYLFSYDKWHHSKKRREPYPFKIITEQRKEEKMKKLTAILISIICLLTGILLGFMISPVKQGFGNNCGNTTNYNHKKEEEQ